MAQSKKIATFTPESASKPGELNLLPVCEMFTFCEQTGYTALTLPTTSLRKKPLNALVHTVSLNPTGAVLTVQISQAESAFSLTPFALIVRTKDQEESIQKTPQASQADNAANFHTYSMPWPAAELLFNPESTLHFKSETTPEEIPVEVPNTSLLRQNRRKLDFFVHKVRSPGARRYDAQTIEFLAREAYEWLPNPSPDRISALIVVIYRLLESEIPLTMPLKNWVTSEVNHNLALENQPKMGVDSRWGYSLRIAYFYWLMKFESASTAEHFILEEHKKITNTFAIESVPNYFKMAMVLAALALVKSTPSQVFTLLQAMNQMLTRTDLWTTPVNFFQSLDRKNLVSNYHEVFKMAIMLEPLKLKREWVQDHDMYVETSFLGDPGRQLVRKILQENGIKFK